MTLARYQAFGFLRVLFIPEGIYIQVNIWYLGVFQVYQWGVLAEIHKWEEIQQVE